MSDPPAISPASKPSDAPAGMPLASPSLWKVLTLCTAWAGVVVGHYWICGWCAWRLGDPTELPLWLKPWNELMQYGISSFLTLVLAAVWWTAAIVLFVPCCYAVVLVDKLLGFADDRDPFGREPASAFWQATGAMGPIFGLTWLSLLILPFEAPYKPEDSGLQEANAMSYPAFAEYLFLSLFAMLVIYVLFAGFALGVGLMMKLGDGGAWQILPPVFLGIILSMAFAFVVGPWVLELPHRLGVPAATACFIGVMTLITAPPMLLFIR
jgi:hypothetical protein